ncbi:protein kinase domain-containing protein [Streptomyces melanogenes]|uniref:Serine/threonine-protein kinase n=1 Tax=Streptomyces melanogenes TaxID=67326 RepID=A0ABZ1XGJ6_9ACTN|nr:protein kinase [Streptomyces melanogenes]
MTDPLLASDPRRLGGIRLLGRLGAGGMGQVYLGRTPGGRLVAVKTVHEHLADDPHYRERFRREAAAARAVTGAHTAPVLDADPDSPVPWLATAFLPGVTLGRAVAAGGALRSPAVRALGSALAEALTAIHAAGLVHRDLKPSNVLVTADGPRVIDFGIARAVRGQALTETGAIIGTPGYLAPELIAGDGPPATAAADVFALGAVLAFAATGRNPFGTGTVAILLFRTVHEEPELSGVPRASGLRELVERCLDKDPEVRPTVRTVLRALCDPRPPLWWREEPVRSLVLADDPVPEPQDAPPPTVRAAVSEPVTGSVRPWRGRAMARRGLLLAGGGGLAALLGYELLRPTPHDGGSGTSWDPVVRTGAAAGGARWTLEPRSGEVDALLVAGASLLVHGTDTTDSSSGVVEARAGADGAPVWQRTADGKVSGWWGTSGGLLLAPDLGLPAVALTTGGVRVKKPQLAPTLGWFTTAGGLLVDSYAETSSEWRTRATDPATGTVRWTTPPGPATVAPAVLGDALLLAPAPGASTRLRCVGVKDGVERWTYPLAAGALAVCALPDGFAVLTTAGKLHVIGAYGRAVRPVQPLAHLDLPAGSTALAQSAGKPLVAAGNRLYGHDVRAPWSRPTLGLDASWPKRLGGARAPVTGGGLLLHWRDAGTLEAVAPATGGVRWSARVGGGVAQVPPVVAGPLVYAAAGNTCTALRLTDGRALRSWPLPDRVSELAADEAGWYARIGKASIRAYDRPSA